MKIYKSTIVNNPSIENLRLENCICLIETKQKFLIVQDKFYLYLLYFYKKYIKRYRTLDSLCNYIFNKMYFIFLKIYSIFFFSTDMRWRNLVSMSDYIERNKCKKILIYKKKHKVFDLSMDVYPKSKESLINTYSKKELFEPEVYISVISNAIVMGASNLISTQNDVIHHDLLDLKNDLTFEEKNHHVIFNKKYSKVKLINIKNMSDLILPVAASFLDGCSNNYAHWMSEVLPKILLFCQNENFDEIPIIVDADLHQNIIDSLLIVTGKTRTIYMLRRKISLRVKTLYMFSTVGYVPYGVRENKDYERFHGVFSKQALLNLQRTLNSYSDFNTKYDFPDKIYLHRSGPRNLSNFKDVKKLLCEKGFVHVETNNLSLLQQFYLFKNVREIVSPSGAALANAILCKPGTIIYILMGQHPNMIYRYWFNMLSNLGVDVKLILGMQVNDSNNDIHTDYSIEIVDLECAMENI